MLYTDKGVRSGGDTYQLIKLGLNSCSIAVLRVLNEEHHQEGDDSCACVDEKLPRVRELKNWAASSPNKYHKL